MSLPNPDVHRLLTVEEALELILREAPAIRVEEIPLADAFGRVLQEPCESDLDMPPFDKAMMDGYAVRSSDGLGPFDVIEEVPAGRVPARDVRPGTATKIMTGAPLPAGADAVQQVEKATRDGPRVSLAAAVRPGQNVAPRGSDLRRGDVVLGPGHVLRAAEIGALSAVGRTRVKVSARPRVAVVATGDELVPPSAAPGPGQIRNSNTSMISTQVRAAGLECDDLGTARDDEGAIRAAVREGLKRDLLLLSGGVSAGDWDLVIPALAAEGVEIRMHQARIKPGRPFCFAPRVFGLPGNPVSSYVIFEVFVRPYIGRWMGIDLARPRVRARLDTPTAKALDRAQFLPARIRFEGTEYVAEILPWRGSADLFTMTRADGFVVIPIGAVPAKGERVECLLLA